MTLRRRVVVADRFRPELELLHHFSCSFQPFY